MIETGYKDNTTADCVEERPNGSERRAEVANSEGKKQVRKASKDLENPEDRLENTSPM